MPKKYIVTTLTPEQESLIPIYRDKWLPISYSTAPLDRSGCNAFSYSDRVVCFHINFPQLLPHSYFDRL